MALHRLTALALTGVIALGASACGDDTPPETAPSTSTSSAAASPSPTTTGPVAPVLPELAKRQDAVGAKAFVKYWFAALTYAMQTGDTTEVERVSASNCETCKQLIKSVHDAYGGGGTLSGTGWTVDGLRSIDDRGDGEHVFGFVKQSPQRYLDKSGAVVKRYKGRKFGVETLITWDTHWVMREAVVL